jgi:hypothetical protein
MSRKWICAIACLLVAPGVAYAAHGRVGLWNVTTSMSMAMPQIPPEALAQMKARGIKMPNGQSFTSQICMTAAEVNADKPPSMGRENTGCQWGNIHTSASGMTGDLVCTGQMKGHGSMQVSYTGNTHYSGQYSFQGNVEGQTQDMKSTFTGDWVKTDCGVVKPAMH